MLKERPRLRSFIRHHKLRPHLVAGRWDGYNAAQDWEGGVRRVWLSEGLRKQMKKMIAEGCWAEPRPEEPFA
jgi:hypothetical protein